MVLDLGPVHGVCERCPFEARCHGVRKHVIGHGLAMRDECPFYQSHRTHETEERRVRKNTWSIMRSGHAPGIIESLREDIEQIRADLPETERVVPEALIEYVEKALGVVGGKGHVRVIAFATDDGRAFSADIHIQPNLARA